LTSFEQVHSGWPKSNVLLTFCSKFKLRVTYQTTSESTALQFLAPEQTVGKKHPYLFTQCEAIHMRSLAPVQDSKFFAFSSLSRVTHLLFRSAPLIKSTYSAAVRVPKGMVALMSATQDGALTTDSEGRSVWNWIQKIPIPAYLTALAVGNLVSKDVSNRSAVWTEPEVIESAAWEFSGTEEFLKAGEELGGKYVWGRYDLLVLPGSFPYGGMGAFSSTGGHFRRLTASFTRFQKTPASHS